MAICGHCEETAKIKHIHEAEVVLSTAPDKRLLLKYSKFKNGNNIFGFSVVLAYFQGLESVMISYTGRYMADTFLRDMSSDDLAMLRRIKNPL